MQSMGYDREIHKKLEEQLEQNLKEIHRYADLHPDEEKNPLFKLIKRIRGRFIRR